jgi:hypothetical protein
VLLDEGGDRLVDEAHEAGPEPGLHPAAAERQRERRRGRPHHRAVRTDHVDGHPGHLQAIGHGVDDPLVRLVGGAERHQDRSPRRRGRGLGELVEGDPDGVDEPVVGRRLELAHGPQHRRVVGGQRLGDLQRVRRVHDAGPRTVGQPFDQVGQGGLHRLELSRVAIGVGDHHHVERRRIEEADRRREPPFAFEDGEGVGIERIAVALEVGR